MSTQLNPQQTKDWIEAIAAVEQVAANTDHESSSKQPLLSLVQTVRTEPEGVLREIAWIKLDSMIHPPVRPHDLPSHAHRRLGRTGKIALPTPLVHADCLPARAR
jgi:hypothetical protein